MYDQTGTTEEDMYGGHENVDPFSVFNEFFRNFSQGGRGGRGGRNDAEDMFFSDFESMFSESDGNMTKKARGSDIYLGIELDFMEAVNGAKKMVEFEKKGSCNTCKGSGCKPGTAPTKCSACSGKGFVFFRQGPMNIQMSCQKCGGQGTSIRTPCQNCRGVGIASTKSIEEISIPKGINTGQNLRVSGKGNTGINGGGNGDLIIKVNVKKNENFLRDGYDIKSDLQVSVTEAILGVSKTVKTLDGEASVKIPAGTEHGHKLKLSGKGVPKLAPYQGERGDHFVEVKIKIPKKLSSRQTELFQLLAKEEANL